MIKYKLVGVERVAETGFHQSPKYDEIVLPSDQIACLTTILLERKKKIRQRGDHNRPLLISGISESSYYLSHGKQWVDIQYHSQVNPLVYMIESAHCKPSRLVIHGFNQSEQRPLGKSTSKLVNSFP